MLISVIIPCYNAGSWILEALESVGQQQINRDEMEVIVVDDGSTDDSANKAKKKYPWIKLITTKNQGASTARNVGTKISTGEFIQYLDADDLLAPGKLKRQLDSIKRSGADIVYGDWQKLRKNHNNLWEKKEIVKQLLSDPEIDLFTDFWSPISAYFFRRRIVEKAGGWDETLKVIDDPYFMMKCVFESAKFEYSPGIAAYYRVHTEDSVSTRDHNAYISEIFENAEKVEKRWQESVGITDKRKKALLKVYGQVARDSYDKNKELFECAYSKLEMLFPGYIPEKPAHLRYISKLFGYRKAESLALWYRKIKKLVLKNTR